MGLLSDLRILYHLALKPVRGKSHAERMENFYGGQAEAYDDFRRRLLNGREAMLESIPWPETGGVWVDMGGGTGFNIGVMAERVPKMQAVHLVDLSTSLLGVARKRFDERGWSHAHTVEADATTFTPPEGLADVVTFSYSLTMIPDWFGAMENAVRILKPGGVIGVVDFYVSRKFPDPNRVKHSWFTRSFWPVWFSSDNVFPSPDHLPFLERHFETVCCVEGKGKVPYIPFIRMPYYRYVGRKRG